MDKNVASKPTNMHTYTYSYVYDNNNKSAHKTSHDNCCKTSYFIFRVISESIYLHLPILLYGKSCVLNRMVLKESNLQMLITTPHFCTLQLLP